MWLVPYDCLLESVTLFDKSTAERALREAKAQVQEGTLSREQLGKLRDIYKRRFVGNQKKDKS